MQHACVPQDRYRREAACLRDTPRLSRNARKERHRDVKSAPRSRSSNGVTVSPRKDSTRRTRVATGWVTPLRVCTNDSAKQPKRNTSARKDALMQGGKGSCSGLSRGCPPAKPHWPDTLANCTRALHLFADGGARFVQLVERRPAPPTQRGLRPWWSDESVHGVDGAPLRYVSDWVRVRAVPLLADGSPVSLGFFAHSLDLLPPCIPAWTSTLLLLVAALFSSFALLTPHLTHSFRPSATRADVHSFDTEDLKLGVARYHRNLLARTPEETPLLPRRAPDFAAVIHDILC